MIDGDPATDGLSLFLLGPEGMGQIKSFKEENTFVGALESFKRGGTVTVDPRPLHRRGEADHGVTYTAIISGRALYGDSTFMGHVVPDLDQPMFRAAIQTLFDELRNSERYDYVLVDTRGGFAFESADICALADSFIVVTEPDLTSFYQDRNLVARINAAARDLGSQSLLRATIVNKAMDATPQAGTPYLDTLEVSFRNELVREFGIRYKETYPIPVALEVLNAYKVQKIPYVSNPESLFCFATLAAFSDILQIVTSRWSVEQVDQWNGLVGIVGRAIADKQRRESESAQQRLDEQDAVKQLRAQYQEREQQIEVLTCDSTAALDSQRFKV